MSNRRIEKTLQEKKITKSETNLKRLLGRESN